MFCFMALTITLEKVSYSLVFLLKLSKGANSFQAHSASLPDNESSLDTDIESRNLFSEVASLY